MPDLLRRFIALVSRLAPGAMRREFRAEWEAELAASWRARPARSWKAGVRVVFRAAGAIPDAWFLNRQQWSADMLLQDVKYALRLLAHRRTYTLVVVATLAAGIGANAAMFSVINAVLLRPLPFREASRLVMVWENDRLNGKPRYLVAPANYDDWRRQSHSFTSLSAFVLQGGTITGGGEPFHASVAVVTPNFLDTLGVVPELGRGLTEADAPPAHRVLLLSHAAWLTHFGGDRGIVDRTVRLGDEAYRVVGVMPRGFEFPERRVDVWRPMALTPQLLATRAQHFLGVFGRLTPGTSLAAAAAELESVAVAAQQRYPETNSQRGTTMVPLQAAIVGDVQRPLYFLGAAVALLLLIACANVANLMVVQSASRRREMAMRAAVGADRFRIARQLLVEGMLLAAAGGAAGIALAAWGVQALGHLASRYIPRADSIALDTAVVAYAAVLSMVTALLFALVPALRASRTSFQRDLREGARGSVGTANRLRRLLVAIEFAAAVVLVAGAVLLLESFWRVLDVQPGFRTSQLLAIDVDVPQQKYGADGALAEFYANLVARLAAVPGVGGAAVVNNLPLSGEPAWTSWLRIEHRPASSGEPPEVGFRVVSAGYLATMGIPLRQGRWLADTDTAASMKVVVINQALADRFFPGEDPIGARVRLGSNPNAPWRTIVGVIGNIRHAGLETEPVPETFQPLPQSPFASTVIVRAEGDRAATVANVRAVTRSIDPSVGLSRARWMDALIDEQVAPRRLSMLLVQGFAGVALALALLGIYGVVSYGVTERIPEIGVRMALGATPGEIVRMVVSDGLRLALPGLVIGIAAALAICRAARTLLFAVSPADPRAFLIVTVGALLVAGVACYLPARRAARIDPLSAIRIE